MAQVKKRRFLQGTSHFTSKAGSVISNSNTSFFADQISSNNPHRWPPKGADKQGDVGGAFYLQSAEWYKLGAASVYVANSNLTRIDSGMVHPWLSGGTPSLSACPPLKTDAVLDAFGTTAIARTLPTAPLSGVGQFIGELKDLPKFAVETWKSRTKGFMNLAKGGSKDYLNVQFGWIPFVNDIISFTKVTRSATRHIDNFLRNSGKTIRRRTSPVTTLTTTTAVQTNSWYGVPPIQTFLVQSAGQVMKTVETETKTWFSGAYRYYVPTDGELLDPKTGRANLAKVAQQNEQLANRLYGTRITPHLLWQLAPWSWAIDWVSNAGDVVKNLSYLTSDNLVLKYGYVMAQSTITETYEVTKPMKLINGSSVRCTQQIRYRTLQRRRATPYGFGLNPDSFTDRQWAIIGALGVSKAPRSLNF